jgi:hypothetical protein
MGAPVVAAVDQEAGGTAGGPHLFQVVFSDSGKLLGLGVQ